MLKDERERIEEKIETMGYYMKMEFLLNYLKRDLDFDMRKFVLVRLSGLYESRRMFFDAGKMMCSAAEINTNVQGKINDLVKAVELFIKADNFKEADFAMMRAMSCGDERQKREIKKSVKEFYKTWARFYLEQDKKQHAMRIYEKLLKFGVEIGEENEIQEKLLGIYNSLGKIKEHNFLKRKIGLDEKKDASEEAKYYYPKSSKSSSGSTSSSSKFGSSKNSSFWVTSLISIFLCFFL